VNVPLLAIVTVPLGLDPMTGPLTSVVLTVQDVHESLVSTVVAFSVVFLPVLYVSRTATGLTVIVAVAVPDVYPSQAV
jgi:hypothetical protein